MAEDSTNEILERVARALERTATSLEHLEGVADRIADHVDRELGRQLAHARGTPTPPADTGAEANPLRLGWDDPASSSARTIGDLKGEIDRIAAEGGKAAPPETLPDFRADMGSVTPPAESDVDKVLRIDRERAEREAAVAGESDRAEQDRLAAEGAADAEAEARDRERADRDRERAREHAEDGGPRGDP